MKEHMYEVERQDGTFHRLKAVSEFEARQKYERDSNDKHIPKRGILKIWKVR